MIEVLDQKKRLCNSFFSSHGKDVRWVFLSFLLLLGLMETGVGKISSLGDEPDWSELDVFQDSWDRTRFLEKLTKLYCPRKEWWAPWIQVGEKDVKIRKTANSENWYLLRFSEERKKIHSQTLINEKQKKIGKIALDPGHIGGIYSEMEGRHFSIDGNTTVKEGNLSLLVARRLKELLEEENFEVVLVREKLQPVTSKRPVDFTSLARNWVNDLNLSDTSNEELEKLLKKRKEVLFYRVSEIRARAKLINRKIRPDLVICLHLNAAPWKNPEHHELVVRNDYHVLVNGCYMGGELAYDDQRLEMMLRLLNGWDESERILAEELSRSFKKNSNLPAFRYHGPNAVKVGKVDGVWGRNLLANRIYRCPVVFLEPYVANSRQAYSRIKLGNYKGLRLVEEEARVSLIEEYAQTVLSGLTRGCQEEN